jgi:hypothetical protein
MLRRSMLSSGIAVWPQPFPCSVGEIISVGSSRGRGTRVAGWFDDFIKEKGHQSMRSLVLLEGIAGWAVAGKEYSNMMDGYEKEVWEKKSSS